MGYTIHHSIIVDLWDGNQEEIYELAKEVFSKPSEDGSDTDFFNPKGIVLKPVELPINGGYLMAVYSNGSKSNWPDANAWIRAANRFLNILDEKRISYALVGFGGDQVEAEIVRDVRTNKLPEWYSHLGLESVEIGDEK